MWTCPDCGREFKKAGQSHFCGRAPASVDAYIDAQKAELRPKLSRLRDAIAHALPGARECIVWGMPTWREGKNILHFAAQKNHIGLYVGEAAAQHFAAELADYDIRKGTIRVGYAQDLPEALIAKIAIWCRAEAVREA